ncbi:MAG: autotransporter outer membrane beta-barrel domain-containing protein [Gemmatimonadota bacterium]|jgi:fibronectin-binding autotransporter adhesin|nr:autotransporter outer membrane beta-barrel domain-containing protein [Gemmatimonadota bacterium]
MEWRAGNFRAAASVVALVFGIRAAPAHAQIVDVNSPGSLTAATGTTTPADGAIWNLNSSGIYLSSLVIMPTNGTLTINGNGNTLTMHDLATPPVNGRLRAVGNSSLDPHDPATLNLYNITITGAIDTQNADYGSAIGFTYLSPTINGDNIIFSDNHLTKTTTGGAYGGAVAATNGDYLTLNVGTISFINNSAATSGESGGTIGGAITVVSSINGGLVINSGDILFSGNSASASGDGSNTVYGGAVAAVSDGGGITISGHNITFSDNSASNSALSGNTYGGAVAGVSDGGSITITGNDILFSNNSASSSVTNGTVYGGAIAAVSVGGGLSITGNNITFTGNRATSTGISGNSVGGAIATLSSGSINITGNNHVLFSGNSAGGLGGAIYAGNSVTLNAAGGDIVFSGNMQNTATTARANAIYFASSNTAVFNTSGHSIRFYDPISGGSTLTGVNISGGGMVLFDGSLYSNAADRTSDILASTTITGAGTILRVDNGAVYGRVGSTVTVQTGAVIAGSGTITGNTSIASGGVLAPNEGGSGVVSELTINGNLVLNSGSILNYNFGKPDVVNQALNDHVTVNGNLTLGGTLNVTQTSGGSFDPGVYRIITYDGLWTNPSSTLALGSLPGTNTYSVQTSVPGQVNLVINAPPPGFYTFWDGGNTSLHGNGIVNGGNGVWQSSAGNTNWTDQTGVPIGFWSNADFAVFMAQPGAVTVDNSLGQVSASGMQFASDGYVVTGNSILLVDSPSTPGQSIIRVGNGTSTGADYTATIQSNLSGTTQLAKHDLGTLVLSGNNSYTGGTEMSGGVVRVAADNNLGAASGALGFDGGTLDVTASFTTARAVHLVGEYNPSLPGLGGTFEVENGVTLTLTGAIDGSGSLTKTGPGTLLLAGTANSYSGNTIVSSGTLRAGAVNVFSPNSAMSVDDAGVLDLAGFSQQVAGLTNAGLVNMGTGTAPGTILTVTGDYIGNGGTIVFNTILGPDSSPTDRMVVDGNTSGATDVRVAVAGGLGAQTTGNGIELVEVHGISDGTFSLIGPPLTAGAYSYNLFKNGVGADASDGNWYLRASLRREVPLHVVVPALASRLGLEMLGTYTHRTGDISETRVCPADVRETADQNRRATERSTVVQCDTRLWARVFGETGSSGENSSDNLSFAEDGPAYDFDFGGMQVGVNLYHSAADGAGLYVGASTLRSNVKMPDGDEAGKAGMDGYTLGGYWTHHAAIGWYTDLVLQGTMYQNIHANSVTDESFRIKGQGLTASVEAGHRLSLGGNYSMTPQGQLVYQRTSIDNSPDEFSLIRSDPTSEVYGRLGTKLTRNWFTRRGCTVSAWGETNLWHQFGADTETTFSTLEGAFPSSFRAALGGTWLQSGLGVSGQLTRNVSLFGAADYNAGISQPGNGFSGRAGVKVSW